MQALSSPLPSEAAVRLVAGMLDAIEDKGYGALTISDVVRHARVSKRTFYEHFKTKEECFLAAYAAASEETLRVIEAAADGAATWGAGVDASVRAYLELLEDKRALTRTFLLEIHAAGPAALAARRAVHGRFAELLRRLVAKARRDRSDVKALSPKLAVALVGGINELVLVALEQDGERLWALQGAATELVRAVVMRP